MGYPVILNAIILNDRDCPVHPCWFIKCNKTAKKKKSSNGFITYIVVVTKQRNKLDFFSWLCSVDDVM